MPSNSAWSSIRASSHSGSLTSTAQSTSGTIFIHGHGATSIRVSCHSFFAFSSLSIIPFKPKKEKNPAEHKMKCNVPLFLQAARPSESKWSPGSGSASNSSLAHELWKVPLPPKALSVAAPSRPPPGLTSQKPSSSSSGWDGSALRLGCWGSSESRYTPGKKRTHMLYCFYE